MPNAYSDDAGVFQNKLGLTDAHQLSVAEYELAAIRADEILTGTFSLELLGHGLERLIAVHLHLFQYIYEWAGKLRTVYSSKRSANGLVTRFVAPDEIQTEWQEVALKIRNWNHACSLCGDHGRMFEHTHFIAQKS